MSFFNLSDGSNAAQTGNSFEMGGGEPIPDNTKLLAIIDEAKWTDYENSWYINLRWNVLQPAEFKGRKVFQKLHVQNADAKKADKAKRMLAAIDANAGGALMKTGKEPDDQDLTSALVNKPMVICVKVWDMNGNKGNWISAVSPRNTNAAAPVAPPVHPVATQSHSIDDEVPF